MARRQVSCLCLHSRMPSVNVILLGTSVPQRINTHLCPGFLLKDKMERINADTITQVQQCSGNFFSPLLEREVASGGRVQSPSNTASPLCSIWGYSVSLCSSRTSFQTQESQLFACFFFKEEIFQVQVGKLDFALPLLQLLSFLLPVNSGRRTKGLHLGEGQDFIPAPLCLQTLVQCCNRGHWTDHVLTSRNSTKCGVFLHGE